MPLPHQAACTLTPINRSYPLDFDKTFGKLFSWIGFLHHIWHFWCSYPVHLLGCWFQECSGKTSLWLKKFLFWSCQKWYTFKYFRYCLGKDVCFSYVCILVPSLPFHFIYLINLYEVTDLSFSLFTHYVACWFLYISFVIPLYCLTPTREYLDFKLIIRRKEKERNLISPVCFRTS